MVRKSVVDKFLDKLNKSPCDNDKEFLECLIDLDERVKKIEKQNV
jgi:hypothetical protein